MQWIGGHELNQEMFRNIYKPFITVDIQVNDWKSIGVLHNIFQKDLFQRLVTLNNLCLTLYNQDTPSPDN